jgi:hypothetical protein
MIRQLIVAIAVAFGLLHQQALATLVFADGDFDDADWTLTLSASSQDGTAMASQVETGGTPGSYRDVLHEVSSTSGLVQAFHFNPAYVYDPGVSGPIDTITWTIDFQNFQAGQAAALLIEQDGVFTVADTFVTTFAGLGTWNMHSKSGITAADFGITPDFSAAGSPISFGFLTANSGQVGTFQVGYDNLAITITPVPEPHALLLLATAALAAGLAKKFLVLGHS